MLHDNSASSKNGFHVVTEISLKMEVEHFMQCTLYCSFGKCHISHIKIHSNAVNCMPF